MTVIEPAPRYDAVLMVAYGGPDGPEDVLPFLAHATRGRNIPPERLQEVASHYLHFGGASPINAQMRALRAALEADLASYRHPLPVYLGNRNWHPSIEETVRTMASDGVRSALLLITSSFSSYSSCRQYQEDVQRAVAAVGPRAPRFNKVRACFNHPGFIEAAARSLAAAQQQADAGRGRPQVVFTAHSIPLSMARQCAYEEQLWESGRLTATAAGVTEWTVAFQSRSGPAQVPWLEPDICAQIATFASAGVREVVVMPIGFLSDHMEVLFDLDHEAAGVAADLNVGFHRAATVGTDRQFVGALRDIVVERLTNSPLRRAVGRMEAAPDECTEGCCWPGAALADRPVRRITGGAR